MPTSWKSEEYNKHLALRVNYAHCVNILYDYIDVSSSLGVLSMWFQIFCYFQVVFMPTNWESEEYNK